MYLKCVSWWVGLISIVGCLGLSSALRADEQADLEFFEKQVRPLLVAHCYECHANGEHNGGLSLDAREHVRAGGDSGPAIVPGEPEKSLLIEAIRYKNRDLQMPPKKPLSEEQVAVFTEWIARGAPDPREIKPAASEPLKGMSLEAGRQFWAFKPLSNPPLPTVKDSSWVQTPIDAFVLAKLESQSLQPAPPADKRTLLRRATFDMLGLPPTPAEMDAFLADNSPGAFAKIVERLLHSPQYGVRWGRHWLDVARYADSNGLDENLAFGTAWRYRDYVVDSFNQDKPFDRFLTEQLAGDLLPNQSAETHIATGFLVLGAKVLAEPDREKLTMDTVDEQIDTLGKAFMGLTLGCARCHDHKFDPISQADYYALAAIFKSTKTFADTNYGAIKHWHEINLATAEEKEKLKAVDEAIAEKQKAAASFKSAAMTKIREEARAKATDYLSAATHLDLNTPLTEVGIIAAPRGLHPRILHHCRRHLEFHADDLFFATWRDVAQSGDKKSDPSADGDSAAGEDPITAHYAPLFKAARDWADAKAKDSQLKPHDDPLVVAAHAALFDTSGFLTVPAKASFAFDEATLTQYNQLADAARVLESFAPDMPSAMSVSEGQILENVPIHIRGSHRNLGEPIARGFPKVMHTSSVEPILPRRQSGRLELAHWLASSTHPLTARVYVNRIWNWHFGTGLIPSTENFGVLGEPSSHPELLDWLARNFIESGWSTKEMHRLLLFSSTYQMASLHPQPEFALALDPENRWLWKFRVQRLDAEQIRDALLYVAGRLDQTLGGKSVPLRNRQFVFDHTSIDHTKYDSLRRAVYLPVIRNNLYTLFEQFDFPDPTMPTGHRNVTTVAPQALLLMNADLMMDSADQLARRLVDHHANDAERVQAVCLALFGRPATGLELEEIPKFVNAVTIELPAAAVAIGVEIPAQVGGATEKTTQQIGGTDPGTDRIRTIRAWSLACQSMMISNEFFMVR